ncbi:ribosome biogenesis factor YjgA [Agaribacterium haliotis]|uniref:ribosome biogenesis factor YjgA n=1 Tax=Agaribacterium haliotis TaxID=2013869 RepID=UPI000BB5709C|nr:ribosome biogenesis factor YjgA [Agaribacterium haliotis]
MTDEEYDFWDDPDYKSKTQVKEEMHELRALGIEIAELPQALLDSFPLNDELRAAINDYRRINHKNALKRQASYVAKLMRREDGEALKARLQEIHDERHQATRQLHLVERWRDRLLDEQNTAFDDFVAQFPSCDRQQLRSLMRNAAKEKQQNKPPASARKLFKFIQIQLAQKPE